MSEFQDKDQLSEVTDTDNKIGKKELRKIRARRHKNRGVWFGLGTFGMIGWSITIPTLIGVALGIWIDNHWSSRFSWTLMLLMAGLLMGCLSAWYWLDYESRLIQEEEIDEELEHE
jgi:ATP synthase protein I